MKRETGVEIGTCEACHRGIYEGQPALHRGGRPVLHASHFRVGIGLRSEPIAAAAKRFAAEVRMAPSSKLPSLDLLDDSRMPGEPSAPIGRKRKTSEP